MIKAAILQSGGPNSPWSKLDKKTIYKRSVALAQKLRCPVSNITDCMRNVSVEEILENQNEVCAHNIVHLNCFVPTIDEELVRKSNQVIDQNIDIIHGYNSNEGFLKLMQFLTKEYPAEKLYTEGFSQEMFFKMLSRMFGEDDEKVIIEMNEKIMK